MVGSIRRLQTISILVLAFGNVTSTANDSLISVVFASSCCRMYRSITPSRTFVPSLLGDVLGGACANVKENVRKSRREMAARNPLKGLRNSDVSREHGARGLQTSGEARN